MEKLDNGNDIITDIELYKFNVSGTNPDTTPPTIDSVIFEPTSLNGPGAVTIKIFSSDNESGIQKNHSINVRLFNKEHNIELNKWIGWDYDSDTGFRGTFTIENEHPSGEWIVDNIHPTNNAGTWRTYKYNENISTTHYSFWNDEEQTDNLSNIPLYTYNISGTNL